VSVSLPPPARFAGAFRLELGLSVKYEQGLDARTRTDDFRLPDFTVAYEGDIYYWEHLGMLDVPTYARKWQRKRRWYEENGYLGTRIDGGCDEPYNPSTFTLA
jgi:hypothetical protein